MHQMHPRRPPRLLLSDGTTWVVCVPGVLATSGLLARAAVPRLAETPRACCVAGERASVQRGALTPQV